MRPLIASALLTLLLTACGQTGPLYLPEKETPKAEPAPAVEPAADNAATAAPPASEATAAGAQ